MSNNSNKNNKLFDGSLIKGALAESFRKLNPVKMIKNPVMFTVWIGTLVMAGVCIWIVMGEKNQGGLIYNMVVTAVLFITLLFANFAESIAEARGKAQADSLRKTREETPAKIASLNPSEGGAYQIVSSASLVKGDIFAGVSSLVLRKLSACALPLASAIDSAKLANKSVINNTAVTTIL